MTEQHPFLEVSNIGKLYTNGVFINGVSFCQKKLQKIAIAGASGAGKTTLLKIISGNLQPTTGKVFLNGERVIGPDEQLLPGHPEIGFLSQQYELLNNYKVEDLIWFDNKLSIEDANKLFTVCEIAHLLKRRTNELSGGEKQRIALCKILVKAPKLLLLDEPFSNLDLIHKNTLKSVLTSISNTLQISCIVTSHDPQDVLSWADEILVMQDGKITQQAKPEQIYFHPTSQYVAGLFGKYNLLNHKQVKEVFGNNIFIHSSQHLLIRPEQLEITEINNALFAAKVINISFWGYYYQIDLQVNDITLVMNLQKKEVEVGETIGLKMDVERICFL